MQLVMYRGDDQAFPLTLTVDGEPVDLTTATVTMTCRAALDDADPVFTLTSTDDEIVIDADQTTNPGDVIVTVASGNTTGMDPATLLCDIEIDIAGVIHTWPEPDYGQSKLIRLKVRADVTHA